MVENIAGVLIIAPLVNLLLNLGSCNVNSTFQCYDGQCIPKSRECDGIIDCTGMYHEDEPDTCGSRRAESCLQWRIMGYTNNGRYMINLPGLGEIIVLYLSLYSNHSIFSSTMY